jgi:hypothetical protein
VNARCRGGIAAEPPVVANLLGMARCENCDAELQSQWKFCVRCGTKVPAGGGPGVIPAAIRPQDSSDQIEPPVRRRFDWHVLAGILVGVVGAAAIIYLIVALTGAGG